MTDTPAAYRPQEIERRLNLVTPEGVRIRFPLASLPRRCLAWLIDVAVIGATLRIVLELFHPLFLKTPGLWSAIQIMVTFAVSLLYAAALEWFWQGQTLGKRVMGIRVMDAQGLPLTGAQVLARNLLRIFDMLPMCYFVGGATALVSRRAQRLGDIAANTVVVAEHAVLAPETAAGAEQKFNSFRAYPDLALRLRRIVTPEEAALLTQALQRRDRLSSAARAELFAGLVEYFQSRVAFPPELLESLSPEQYLRNCAAVLFQRDYRVGGQST